MSYDIYGQPLQSGHCEVHPHVHEEYPCSVCVQENNARINQATLEQQYEEHYHRLLELENERSRLCARVNQLENTLNQAIELLVTALNEPEQITDKEIAEFREVYWDKGVVKG